MTFIKAFKIELSGGKDVAKDVNAIKASMTATSKAIKQVKADLDILFTTGGDTSAATKKLTDLQTKLVSLNQERNTLINTQQKEIVVNEQLTKTIGVKTGEYFKLNLQYKEAVKNAQNLATQYGVEDQRAIEAARSAGLLKDQLLQVNALVKTAGNVPTPAVAAIVGGEENIAVKKAEEVANIELAQSAEFLAQKELELAAAQQSAAQSGNQRAQLVKDEAAALQNANVQIAAATTKYQEYTGSLRDNIRVQLENEGAIEANRVQQKLIEKDIKANGAATQQQVGALAALREEEQLIIATNKELAVTIRNQAKELIATEGSLDRYQAQLNQIKQAYTLMADTEKASPFGQKLKNEIDILEPKVKELEAEIGDFTRNVGNYPEAYRKAFQVLNTELDKVQGKLVQGNFTGKELEELSKKQAVLSQATQALGKNYDTTAKQQTAFRESARQIGLTYGLNSDVFQNFAKEVQAGNVQLKKTDTVITATTKKGNAFTGALSGIFSQLRNIAYIIPGIGIAGLIGLILTPLGALGSSLFEYATKARGAAKASEELSKSYEALKEAVHSTEDEFVDAASAVELLTQNINLAKKGLLEKDDVLKQYNDGLGKTIGLAKSLDEAEQKLIEHGAAYIEMMATKAAAAFALEQATKAAFRVAEAEQKKASDFQSIGTNFSAGTAGQVTTPGFVAGLNDINAGIAAREKAAEEARQKKIKEEKAEEDRFIKLFQKLQEKAAQTAKDNGFNFFPEQKEAKGAGAKGESELERLLKLIEANRLRQIAIENNATNEILKVRELSFDEEIAHVKKTEAINVDAFDKKISLFQRQKKLNADEKKTLAEFGEQKSALELDTNKKVADIEKRRFDRQAKDLKNALDKQINSIKEANEELQNDPSVSNLDKAEAQVESDNEILEAQADYYEQLLVLNSNFNKDVLAQSTEAMSRQRVVIERNRKLIFDGTVKDIADASGILSAEFKQKIAEATTDILTSDLSPFQQAEALVKLQEAANLRLLKNQKETLEKDVAAFTKARQDNLITEKQYQEKLAEFKQAEAALTKAALESSKTNIQNFKDAINDLNSISDIAGIKTFQDTAEGRAKRQAEGFKAGLVSIRDAINTTYQSIFKAEENRIERQKQNQLDFLDREKERVLATAQSGAERETIEKKFELRRQQVEREAAEKRKKLALKQATIDFAVAAIKTYASYGFPAGLLAVAGLAAAYFAQRAAIQQQQFADSGLVQPERVGPGRIRARQNIRRTRKGDTVLATVKPGEVVLNEKHQAMLGGARTFRRIGVPGFASSGLVTGPQLGTNLQAPSFNSGFYSGNVNQALNQDQSLNEMRSIVSNLAEMIYASDQKQVVLSSRAVTNAQNKNKKDVSVGTI